MPSPYIVNVRVKPYIRKYLIHISENKAEPIIFRKNDHHYNRLLKLLISHSRFRMLKMADPPDEDDSLVQVPIQLRYTCSYNDRPDVRDRHFLSREGGQQFNRSVSNWFKLMASDYIAEKVLNGVSRLDAVYMFMEMMAITDDDIKSESFYRYWTRLRNELVNKS
jgi:hypothetical protein